jgi:hypothetical protein
MMEITEHIKHQSWKLLVDQHIGGGSARAVWSSLLFPDAVIKVEDDARSFQNVMEWETWHRVKGSAYEKWFAPCLHISPDGTLLLMAKTTLPGMSDLPPKMPIFLCDFKRTNYGLLDGRIVCHDYGLPHSIKTGMSKRMQDVTWTDNVKVAY